MRKIFVTAWILLVLYPAALNAQTCHGTAPLTDERPIQVGGGATFAENVSGVAGTLTAGDPSLFGSILFRRDSYDVVGVTGTGYAMSLWAGAQLPVDETRRLMICPEFTFTRFYGPNNIDDAGTDISANVPGGGVSVGFVAVENSTTQIVPTVQFSVSRFRTTVSTVKSGESESRSTLELLTAGVGFVMSKWISILPAVGIPLRSGSEKYFTIGIMVSLGN